MSPCLAQCPASSQPTASAASPHLHHPTPQQAAKFEQPNSASQAKFGSRGQVMGTWRVCRKLHRLPHRASGTELGSCRGGGGGDFSWMEVFSAKGQIAGSVAIIQPTSSPLHFPIVFLPVSFSPGALPRAAGWWLRAQGSAWRGTEHPCLQKPPRRGAPKFSSETRIRFGL